MNGLKFFQKEKRAFTLIELLIVIAIIGILSSVTLVSLSNARLKARDANRKLQIQGISRALETYYAQYGRYPTTLSPYTGDPASGTAVETAAGSDRAAWINNTGYNGSPGGAPGDHPLGLLKDAGIVSKVPIDPGANTYVGAGSGNCGGTQFYGYWSNGTRYMIAAPMEAMGTTGCNACPYPPLGTPTSWWQFQFCISGGG